MVLSYMRQDYLKSNRQEKGAENLPHVKQKERVAQNY
jgi:hypothetical protein